VCGTSSTSSRLQSSRKCLRHLRQSGDAKSRSCLTLLKTVISGEAPFERAPTKSIRASATFGRLSYSPRRNPTCNSEAAIELQSAFSFTKPLRRLASYLRVSAYASLAARCAFSRSAAPVSLNFTSRRARWTLSRRTWSLARFRCAWIAIRFSLCDRAGYTIRA
jgi:hypothetical protein